VRPKHGVRARCSIRFITSTPSRTSNRKAVVIEVDGVCRVCDLYNFLFLGPFIHVRLTVRIAATLTSLPRGSMQSQEKRFPLLRSVISASGVSLPGLTSSFYVRLSVLQIPQTPLSPVLRAPFPLEALLPLTPFMRLPFMPFIRAIGGIANVRTDEHRVQAHSTQTIPILRLWNLLFHRPRIPTVLSTLLHRFDRIRAEAS
jgi:hypothetical protein